jgi:hypothetical protein
MAMADPLHLTTVPHLAYGLHRPAASPVTAPAPAGT